MRRSIALAVLALVMSSVGVREASACSCIPQSPCRTYASADAVFVGEIVDVREEGRLLVARFRISRAAKGVDGDMVTVFTESPNHSSCSAVFEVGQRRVIYAHRSEKGLETSYCSGGGLVTPGGREPELPPIPGSIRGRVVRPDDSASPDEPRLIALAGVAVWIALPGGRLDTTTDGDGRFLLTGITGKRPALHVELGPMEDADTLLALETPEDCIDTLVVARPSGRIGGAIVDAASRPLPNIYVVAWPVDGDKPLANDHIVMTNGEGRYDIRHLKAGRYYVGVNVFGAPMVRQPFPPTWHPGVTERDAATIFEISPGLHEAEPMVLAQRLPLTQLEVEVRCRDKTPAASAHVYATLIDVRGYDSSEIETPTADGRYVVPVLQGQRYRVRAYGAAHVVSDSGGQQQIRSADRPTDEVVVDTQSHSGVVGLTLPLDRCVGVPPEERQR